MKALAGTNKYHDRAPEKRRPCIGIILIILIVIYCEFGLFALF